MTLTLFSFSKRQNSTAVPSSGGTAVDVVLKNETSMNNPVFLLSGARPDATYCQFEGAYYFIDDVRSVRTNLWEIICTIDVLGTYRTEIGNTVAFVEYATEGNSDVIDSRLPVVGMPSTSENVGATVADVASDGSGIIGGVVVSTTGYDGCCAWITSLDGVEFLGRSNQTWADSILQDNPQYQYADSWSGVGQALLDCFNGYYHALKQLIASGNALDNLKSAIWLPFVLADGGSSAKKIYLGNYDTGIFAIPIKHPIRKWTSSIAIPWQFSDWRNNSPYTEIELYLPFFGVISIPASSVRGIESITLEFALNMISGDLICRVYAGAVEIGMFSTNAGVSLPVGSSNVNPLQAASGIISGLTLAANGNFAAAVGITMAGLQQTPRSSGHVSGTAATGIDLYIRCKTICHDLSAAPGAAAAAQGIPLFAQRTLSSLTGYVQTRGASVQGAIRGVLRDQINDILDSGFFRE